MQPHDHDHDEILRLRDRMHEVLNKQAALALRLQSIEEWRAETRVRLEGIGKACDELAEQIEALLKSDEIADAITAKMNHANTLRLTFVQRLAASVTFVLTVAASVKVLLA